MRTTKLVLISAALLAGCIGTASAQYDPYTPTVDEEGGVPARCSIEYSAMIKDGKDDLAVKVTVVSDSKAPNAPTVYFSVGGQRLTPRAVKRFEISQATIEAGTIKLEGGVVKPSETGSYGIGTTGEAALLLPLTMTSGSKVSFVDDGDTTNLTLPAASEATRQQLFSCFQRGTGFPESIRPEAPGAAPAAAAQ